MAAISTIVAVGGLALSAGSKVMEYQAQKKQQSEMKRQAELAKRKADIENARALRQSIRQSRLQQGSLVNQGAAAGALMSSGVQGGQSSILAQQGANQSYFGEVGTINRENVNSNVRMGEAQYSAQTWGTLGSLGGTIFSGAEGFKTIFGGNKGPYQPQTGRSAPATVDE